MIPQFEIDITKNESLDKIDRAVRKVVSPKLYDPNSVEFRTAAFNSAPPPQDFDPMRTPQDVIDEGMMRYSSAYHQILEMLLDQAIKDNQ